MSTRPIADWLRDGRRFSEEEAILVALDAAHALEAAHQGREGHPRPRAEQIGWDPGARRADLSGVRGDCPGVAEDVKLLGDSLLRLLGAASASQAHVTPAFRAVLEKMLDERAAARHRSARALAEELSGALAGAAPARMLWESKRNQRWAVVAVSVVVLAWSIYRGATGPNRVLKFAGNAWHVELSPDGKRLASSAGDVLRHWDTTTWRERWISLPDAPKAADTYGRPLAFSPDSRFIAAAAENGAGRGMLHVFDLEGDSRAWSLDVGGSVDCLAFSPDGTKLAACVNPRADESTAAGGKVLLLTAPLGERQAELHSGHDRFVWVAWEPGTTRLLYRARRWYAPSGRYGNIRFASREPGPGGADRLISEEPGHNLGAIALDPRGAQYVAADGGNERLAVYGFRGGWRTNLNSVGPSAYRPFTPGAFDPEGKRFAGPFTLPGRKADRRVRLWRTEDWKLLRDKAVRYSARNAHVRDVALGRRWMAALAGNDFNAEIHLWDVGK